ncbi:22933_t:CDS:1 [Entrophospora sp. SA101]|nr:5510_t:CDS:1 [Entrophospora sp. SA101]CAJ0637843.1 12040_t:CDS:1 [Entrophospora sp. SA101]CAJ0750027.1 22933_t:CDS:1 [Entrophospora sp. SA101]CAJ0832992.1 13919_t:CDS:1 [Entrophospora sp. SA101]CAJ0837299.1 1368_t:CDS:1 [Entrophospora sp. SA101]
MTTAEKLLGKIPEGHVLRIQTTPPSKKTGINKTFSFNATATTQEQEFQTNNWDTVFAVHIADVNKAIVNGMTKHPEKYPQAWNSTIKGSIFSPSYSGSGTFGAWQVTLGGSSTILKMKVPVKNCTIIASSTTIPVESATAYIEVHLKFLPHDDNENHNILVVKTTTTSSTDPVVVVLSIVQDNVDPQNNDINNALKNLLQNWFNDNLIQFSHVFATVDLNITAAAGDGFQWLHPTTTSYAYIDGATEDDSVLAILSMVNGNSSSDAVQSVEAGAIPKGSRACLSISKKLFITQMIMPNLKNVFIKSPADNFITTHNGMEVEIKDSIALNSIFHAGLYYYPTMTKYTMTINVDTIEMYMFIHIPISPGIDAYAETTSYYRIKLVTAEDGTQKMTYEMAKDPVTHTWHEVAVWVDIVEGLADVILAVVAIGIANAISATKSVVIRLVISAIVGGLAAAVAAVLEKIPEWIAEEIPKELPSLDGLITNAFKSINWTDSGDFELTAIGFNGSFQMSGDPHFGEK